MSAELENLEKIIYNIMSSIFRKLQVKKPKQSRFNLSHEVKLSCNFGELIPILCQEALPGDVFASKSQIFTRFAPLLAPVMHRINVYTHYFFVPNRLIWDEWEDFITGGDDMAASPVHPYFLLTDSYMVPKGSLFDYLGLPTGVKGLGKVSSLPFRAYNLIFNEWYRDQNLQKELAVNKSSGQEAHTGPYSQVAHRCWEKDYFTSALPFAQKGGDVHISAGESAPVVLSNTEKMQSWVTYNGDRAAAGDASFSQRGTGAPIDKISTLNASDGARTYLDPNGTLKADLSNSKGTTINQLRDATRLQEFLEIAARAGSRFKEQLFAHFGVMSKDSRLDRPELIGGGSSNVVISDVPQTSQSTDTSAQATLAGNALSFQENNGFKYKCAEHGFIIGIMSVLPRTAYQQGINKMFLRDDKFDYAFPVFANLGEQPILNKELYVSGAADDDEVFGYTPRYAEYKYQPSRVCGDMRDNLSFWHLGRQFKDRPTLSSKFVECDHKNLSRIFAVEDEKEDKLWVQIYNDVRAIRKLPYFGTPQL